MLSDAHFDDSGALIYGMADALNRTTILANGRPVPFFPVATHKYRLRLVNASTWRFFRLSFAGRTVTQIGSDGGLLPAPVQLTEVIISPGERVELVVDFSADAPGTQVVLDDLDGAGSVMRFDVTRRVRDTSRIPSVLRPLPALPRPTAERRFELKIDEATFAGLINGKAFDATRVDTTIRQGTTEDWLVYNGDTTIIPGGLHHNFHSHLVQFRVVDRDGKAPLPGESGLKDTVRIAPGETVRLRATFGGFLGKFPYHCHLIEHSTMGMMAQMEITS
jgi:FtsP/CotA-like multicopper oxidase with cupredoxin domain